MKIPYIGSQVLASSLCMDKAMTKEVLKAGGIDQVASCTLTRTDFERHPADACASIVNALGLPLFCQTFAAHPTLDEDIKAAAMSGISRVEGKLCEDVDTNSALAHGGRITPVPEGIVIDDQQVVIGVDVALGRGPTVRPFGHDW